MLRTDCETLSAQLLAGLFQVFCLMVCHVVLLSGSATHDTINQRQKLQDFYCIFLQHLHGSLRKSPHLYPLLLCESAGYQFFQRLCPVVCHIATFCKVTALLPRPIFSEALVVRSPTIFHHMRIYRTFGSDICRIPLLYTHWGQNRTDPGFPQAGRGRRCLMLL